MRSDYHSIDDRFRFDAELLENVIIKMKMGKAAGLDGITTHLKFCHALLPCVLSTLLVSHVPSAFGQSWPIMTIPKGIVTYTIKH